MKKSNRPFSNTKAAIGGASLVRALLLLLVTICFAPSCSAEEAEPLTLKFNFNQAGLFFSQAPEDEDPAASYHLHTVSLDGQIHGPVEIHLYYRLLPYEKPETWDQYLNLKLDKLTLSAGLHSGLFAEIGYNYDLRLAGHGKVTGAGLGYPDSEEGLSASWNQGLWSLKVSHFPQKEGNNQELGFSLQNKEKSPSMSFSGSLRKAYAPEESTPHQSRMLLAEWNQEPWSLTLVHNFGAAYYASALAEEFTAPAQIAFQASALGLEHKKEKWKMSLYLSEERGGESRARSGSLHLGWKQTKDWELYAELTQSDIQLHEGEKNYRSLALGMEYAFEKKIR